MAAFVGNFYDEEVEEEINIKEELEEEISIKEELKEERSNTELDEKVAIKVEEEVKQEIEIEEHKLMIIGEYPELDQKTLSMMLQHVEEKVCNGKGKKKRNFCLFCRQEKTNLARHLERQHSSEEKVEAFLKLNKGSQARNDIISELRKEGNFLYNTKESTGRLILARQKPAEEVNKSNYIACPHCKIFLTIQALPKHIRKFHDSIGQVRSARRNGRMLLTNVHPLANKTMMEKILPPMKRDTFFEIVISDKLIIQYGNYCTGKYEDHQQYIIRQRMRALARYFLTLNKLCPEICELSDLYHPKYIDAAFTAVEELGCLYLVHVLRFAGSILENSCEGGLENIREFLKLLHWRGAAIIKPPPNQQNKVLTLPTTTDVKKFKKYLLKTAADTSDLLKEGFVFDSWKRLSEVCLLYLTVYNRKRSGEAQRILLDDFRNVTQVREKDQTMFKIVSRGKRNCRDVFVPEKIYGILQYLVSCRADACIHQKNPYLFALPGIQCGKRFKTLETCQLMRKYSQVAGLQRPDLLRTQLLRKHLVQTTNKKQNFVKHEGIHKKIYKQTPVANDVVVGCENALGEIRAVGDVDMKDIKLASQVTVRLERVFTEDSPVTPTKMKEESPLDFHL